MIGELTNHVWQSTLFAAAAGLLTVACRGNRAQVRYWLWFSTSIKFFVPFALIMGLGSRLTWTPAAEKFVIESTSLTMAQIAQPFSDTLSAVPSAPQATNWTLVAILGVWACGFAAVSLLRLRTWFRIRAALRASVPIDVPAPVSVRSSPGLLEPGVVGLFRPVLLMPAGVVDHLTPAQLDAVLAHELCHVRRRDNLFAAIHMMAEAAFWFHPLVWWTGARLVEERERACDEAVLSLGSEPGVYAEAILNVCKLYVESPLVCVSGVTGADLKGRIEAIMTNQTGHALNLTKRVLLAGAGAAAVALPLVIGVGHAPAIRAQQPTSVAPAPVETPTVTQAVPVQTSTPPRPAAVHPPKKPLIFDAVTIKPNTSDSGGGRRGGGGGRGSGRLQFTPGRVAGTRVSARQIVREAYRLRDHQLSGAPGWFDSDRFDIEGKSDSPADDSQLRQMLQAMLAERFKLAGHRETREMAVYALTVGKNGLKVPELKPGDPVPTPPGDAHEKHMVIRANMELFADLLSNGAWNTRPVLDKTGLQGTYFFALGWDADEDFLPTLQEQFGLKLESQKAPVDILVVDRIEKPEAN